ncbi:ATP-binding cassette, subfamily C/ATP-binding cassette, subfamily C, CydC [Amycolatopsis arida]|uniref:ATP-binding cassette, subfamily C/ATP-binding cassette, subfamily C, CydC n=1 Tax=Amycolatopsis arida TaxID=587909 RepID=A0A1I5YE49_9PSEU|nr:ATP-binding cassette subfamily C protein/ATP-binding cassette subfamily C protein CydC [Amycolatopsis arida]SFQ42390.1 ATP-binding cassette, subfamily C/ATP-binding cassette, subfamily C, CydC [Amycolatopsis arida]
MVAVVATAGVLGAAAELAAVALLATAAWLLARAAEQPPLASLGLAIVGVRAFALSRGGLRYAERLAGHDAALRVVARLRERVFLALAGRRDGRDGDALSRMVGDTESAQDLVLRCLLPGVSAAAVAVGASALCWLLLPAAGAVLLAGLVVAGMLVPTAAAMVGGRLADRVAAARGELAVRGLDLVDGAPDLAAFGATGLAEARAERTVARLVRAERVAGRVGTAVVASGVLVQGLTAVGVALVALRAEVGEVLVAVLALTALAAVEAVLPVAGAARRYRELRPALRRVAEPRPVTGAPRPRPGRASPVVPADASRPAGLRPGGTAGPGRADRIVLSGVRVDYGGRTALAGVDLEVAAGRAVAVVGASGAGKSTLLGVLAGLVEPSAGTVRVPEARALTQDAHVFAASIRANLALARPGAGDAELAEAARVAGVAEWVERLPRGWDTVVGEGGQGMSGGQRQRLLLARALLADPPVLLLDEPTEGMEDALGTEVLRRVLRSRAGRTTVVVTHRLADLAELGFHEALVLDAGRVVARVDSSIVGQLVEESSSTPQLES